LIVLCACAVHFIMGTTLAWTNLPMNDEGFYGVPAHFLSSTGALRDPVLEPVGFPVLRGVDQFFYWMAPMGMVLQAGAFKVFGFGLHVQRELSVICGTGAVLLWFLALRRLIPERVAALGALLLAIDFAFLTVSSRGRSDLMSLFFAMAALAAYLHWRERRLALALAAANIACALSGMIHPNGGLAAVAALLALVLCLDRARLRWSYLAIVAACYGVLAMGWGLWVAKAPDLFETQFFGNVAGRLGQHAMTPVWLVRGEMMRYWSAYALENAHGAKLVKVLVPLALVAATLYCVFSSELRRQARVLLWMFGAVSLTLVLLEGSKQGWYLVHVLPYLAAFAALSIHHLWQSGTAIPRMSAVAQACCLLIGLASVAYTASGRNLQRLYTPMESYLNSHLGPGEVVFGGSEVYFGLDCHTCLRDDANLGALTHRQARLIVFNGDYTQHLDELRRKNPEVYQNIEKSLGGEYREVFHNANYQVMERVPSQ
jgi:4-amino-4-deoxy-L-arabinose transferase-like glycosyltransferase